MSIPGSRAATAARPTVLFLGCHLPFPPLSGGRRRELELIERLSPHFDVHLMVVSKTFEQDCANRHELERFCKRVEVFAAELLPADVAAADEPPAVLRHRCPQLSERVAEVLDGDGADLVHVEGYYLMQHVPDDVRVPVLLVEQNIEYDLERQRAAAAGAAHDLRTHRAEVAAWRRADSLGVLTSEDREMLLGTLPAARVRLVPDGADHVAPRTDGSAPVQRPDEPLIVFLANFGYAPNVDATAYLCDSILPRLRDEVPDVNLWLVGTDPPEEVQAHAGERVRVTGRVPDVVPYIDAADVMVCPLRIGGGVKVKAIEALRRGKCVVSSSVGAQGLPPEVRGALSIANEPEAFAGAVARLLREPALREVVERRSARAARKLPTWDAAGHALLRAYGELLERPAAVGARRLAGVL
jgi:glycosyltransferase involved in cell wall biosynthesis